MVFFRINLYNLNIHIVQVLGTLVFQTPQRSNQRLSSSSDSSTSGPTTPVTNNEPNETYTLQNTELTKAPPPSYNEALHLKHVQPPPPEYTSQEPEEKLPYPVSPYHSDPAYPPQPPPIGFDNQGYPPPTQYPPLGTVLLPLQVVHAKIACSNCF